MNPIPRFISRRIAHRPNLVKIVDNIGWLFFDKILRMGVGLLVGVWIARYLGPEQFGMLNFALAFTGLFGAIATVGLQGIVVRNIVRAPESAGLTLGTAGLLQLLGGLVSYLLILGVIAFLRPHDALARTIVAILGATMLFKAGEIAVYWFESQVQSKYTVWVQNGVFLIFAALKVVLILNHASLLAFVWVSLAEAAVVALALIIVMNRLGHTLASLKVTAQHAVTLFRDCWPLIFSGIAVSIYMKIDQVMLSQMVGDAEVGIYSAAVRISEVWHFIPMAIVASVFPSVLEAKKHSQSLYIARLQKLYDSMVIISVAIALPMSFLATPVVALIFGDSYRDAGHILAIHTWTSIFIFLGVASSQWFLTENQQTLSMQRTCIGCIANICLNIWLIPAHGATGAAIATLASQAIAALFFDALQPVTRPMFYMKLSAINPLRAAIKYHKKKA